MDENCAPYLVESGVKLELKRIQSAEFNDITRISEEKTFSKGMMLELKNLSKLPMHLLLDLVKCILPLPLSEVVENMNVNTFKSKMQVLEKNNKNARKTKTTYPNFLKGEFLFTPEKRRESPRKRALKEQLHQTKKAKTYAEEQLGLLRQQKDAEEVELANLEAENTIIKEKMAQLESAKFQLAQKIRGIKSGISRRQEGSSSRSNHGDEEEGSAASFSRKSVSTSINSIMSNDIIVIEEGISNQIFQGKKYFGNNSGHKKISDGWRHFYAELSEHNPCSKVTKKDVQRRAKFIDDIALKMSCSTSTQNSDEERKILYTELVKQNTDLFRSAFKDAGIDMFETLTPDQTIDMQTLLRMPTNKLRNLRICLNNFNVNCLPSERKMRQAKAPKTAHVSESKVESGFIGLRKTKNDDNVTPCTYIRVKDLKSYIEEIIDRDTAGFSESEHFDNKWWLLFAGDKGGNHMKYHVEVINSMKAGSVDNVHIYCMFEAQDSVINMRKVWLPYHEQVKAMQAEGFTLRGKEVVVFLGGDYHFLDDNMGHQGSSASYPSSTDKVILSHLQNHSNCLHTPENCPTELRTLQDYFYNYNENLADDRNNNNLHDNGKFHNSVVGPTIFPLKSIDNLVPASMHINLGIVLLVYNLLLNECQHLDSAEGDIAAHEREVVEQEWEIASLAHADAEKKLQEHGESVVTMANRLNRHEAVIKGDTKQNMELSKLSDTSRRKKSYKDNEECKSATCIITKFDVNIDWVECDGCTQWYHTMCEALTPLQEITVRNSESYMCIKCAAVEGESTVEEAFYVKVASLVDEEEKLNASVITAQVTCDDLHAMYRSFVGSREKALNDALESIKVVRQAYHGNVLVGNHCVIVLRKYLKLTSVIEDQATSKETFDEIFSLLSQIMKLVMARRFLNDNKCIELKQYCTRFGERFPILFPLRNITHKIHEINFQRS